MRLFKPGADFSSKNVSKTGSWLDYKAIRRASTKVPKSLSGRTIAIKPLPFMMVTLTMARKAPDFVGGEGG